MYRPVRVLWSPRLPEFVKRHRSVKKEPAVPDRAEHDGMVSEPIDSGIRIVQIRAGPCPAAFQDWIVR